MLSGIALSCFKGRIFRMKSWGVGRNIQAKTPFPQWEFPSTEEVMTRQSVPTTFNTLPTRIMFPFVDFRTYFDDL